VAAVLVVGLGAAAYVTLGRGYVGASSSPTPSPDIHSKEAVIAAVKHYYTVLDQARGTGNEALIDTVAQEGSTANNNLKSFLREQAARNRRGVAKAEYFENWAIEVQGERAQVKYTNWSTGHDIDATSSAPLEPDTTTTKGRYSGSFLLGGGRWLATEVTLTQDNAP
jgi:hypothetical protein